MGQLGMFKFRDYLGPFKTVRIIGPNSRNENLSCGEMKSWVTFLTKWELKREKKEGPGGSLLSLFQ